jgi:hypothetical protein
MQRIGRPFCLGKMIKAHDVLCKIFDRFGHGAIHKRREARKRSPRVGLPA